jgi:hypothetical protein
MRKILFILFILSNTIYAMAQSTGRQWYEGTIYHTSGEVFHGLISWTPPMKGENPDGDQVLYRADERSDIMPIPYYKINAFTMEPDSFVVSANVKLKNSPIMLVEVDGPTKLFAVKIYKQGFPLMIGTGGGGGNFGVGMEVATAVGRGVKTAYYYGNNQNNVIKLDKKNFIQAMSTILDDKPEVVAKIKDETFRYNNIDALLTYYYTGKLPKTNYDN